MTPEGSWNPAEVARISRQGLERVDAEKHGSVWKYVFHDGDGQQDRAVRSRRPDDAAYTTKELSPRIWPDFERLSSQGGVWDFCACMLTQRGCPLSERLAHPAERKVRNGLCVPVPPWAGEASIHYRPDPLLRRVVTQSRAIRIVRQTLTRLCLIGLGGQLRFGRHGGGRVQAGEFGADGLCFGVIEFVKDAQGVLPALVGGVVVA